MSSCKWTEEEISEEDLKKFARQAASGKLICNHCWWSFNSWPEFFKHHREIHPKFLDAAIADADKYIEEWKKLIALKENYL